MNQKQKQKEQQVPSLAMTPIQMQDLRQTSNMASDSNGSSSSSSAGSKRSEISDQSTSDQNAASSSQSQKDQTVDKLNPSLHYEQSQIGTRLQLDESQSMDDKKTKNIVRISPAKKRLNSVTGMMRLNVRYAVREARLNKFQFCLGCTSVFVVVVMISILLTAISYSPVVFLTLSEAQSGEVDTNIYSAYWSQYNRLNYTKVAQSVQGVTDLHTPRIMGIQPVVYRASSCTGFDQERAYESNFTYTGGTFPSASINAACRNSASRCINALCSVRQFGNINVIDSKREAELGIGRGWNYGVIPSDAVLIHNDLAALLGNIQPGDFLFLSFSLNDLLPVTMDQVSLQSNFTFQDTQVNIPVRVQDVIPSNLGKLKQAVTNSLFIEFDTVLEMVSQHLSPKYPQAVFAGFRNASTTKQQSQEITDVYFACSSYRVGCYLSSSFNDIAQDIIGWASDIVYAAGFTQIQSNLSLLSNLKKTNIFSAFLNLIFGIVFLILGGLSIFLIYSLLMVSVETKTFEYGIFRMVGMTKIGVVSLILTQAILYALPAWVLGLIVSQLVWLGFKALMAQMINADVGPYLSGASIVVATVVGLVVPILAAILPIRNALTGNLHDALDTRRSKVQAVVVTIERASAGRVPLAALSTGILLTVFGFVIYYFLPLALITQNIALLFNIFLVLLVGMLLGLVMLSLNIQPLLEKGIVFVLFICLWFENRGMSILVLKNLLSHRLRNRKTSIMYALALGFIIFLTVAIQIELQSLIYQTIARFNGDIRIDVGASYVDSRGIPFGIVNMPEIAAYIDDQRENIDGYFCVTFQPSQVNNTWKSTSVSNIGKTVDQSQNYYAVSPSAFSSLDSSYLLISSENASLNKLTLGERLYTLAGSYSYPLGTQLQTHLNLQSFTDPYLLRASYQDGTQRKERRLVSETLAFVNSAPYFAFSQFPSSPSLDVLTSFTNYLLLMNDTFTSVDQIPIQNMIIKLAGNISDGAYQRIVRELNNLVTFESVTTLKDQLAGIISAQNTLRYIFLLITLVSMVVAFFSLNSSVFTNIMEQRKEIGVLRSLGLTRHEMLRLYTYESFVLIMSSAILGTLIGVVMGWSMAAQRSVMTQVPLEFFFPIDIFLLVIGISVVCAILSTISPVVQLIYRNQIITLVR
ncbi:hypothetical protein MP228_002861 [Amoeboaphelidium protococcarum]|nr:hypothetical protein MP228_002861 [Amoeboaphelidium protococcarum]